jgi:hypothetical protein
MPGDCEECPRAFDCPDLCLTYQEQKTLVEAGIASEEETEFVSWLEQKIAESRAQQVLFIWWE